MTREITDEDRRLFYNLDDDEIAAIIDYEEQEAKTARDQIADDVDNMCVEILRDFGYQGLKDYFKAQVGDDKMTARDFEHIANLVAKQRYAEMAQLLSTIISAPECSSRENLDAKKSMVKSIMAPLQEGNDEE